MYFQFRPETKEMYLDALFPGVALDDVKAMVNFKELKSSQIIKRPGTIAIHKSHQTA